MNGPTILYVTRRSPDADAAFHWALRLAEARDGSLTLLHPHRGSGPRPATGHPLALDRLAHRAARRGVPVECLVLGRSNSWADEMEALDWDRWEVVFKVAEPRAGPARILGTTVDQRLARAPRIPVFFVPASRGAGIRVVVAGVDAAHADHAHLSAQVVRAAVGLAGPWDAHLHLVYTWSLLGESILTCPVRGMGRRRVRSAVRGLRERHRRRLKELASLGGPQVEVTPLMVRGAPDEALRRTASKLGADVLVLGTLAREGLEGVLVGNLAERFPGRDGLGVLVVKEEGSLPVFAGREVAA